MTWGAWVAQSVKHLTLDFGSGHDLSVVRFSPELGSRLTPRWAWSLLKILSLPLLLPLPPAHVRAHSHYLSQKKKILEKKKKKKLKINFQEITKSSREVNFLTEYRTGH